MPITNASPKAYKLYLAGQQGFSIIQRRQLEASAAKFRKAVELSPKFARAWGHLAYSLAQIVVAGHARGAAEAKALLKEAEAHARKAVRLDQDDYANRWDLAFVLLNQGRHKPAIAEYDRALKLFDHRTDKLDRRNDLLVEMAEAHIYVGNTKRAFELLDRAVRIPDWYRWIRAWACYNTRDYKGAIAQIEAMHKKPGDPGYVPDIQLLLAAAYAQHGGSSTRRAMAAKTQLAKGRAGWTMARELARNPFTNAKDRKHWEEGMKKAGFA